MPGHLNNLVISFPPPPLLLDTFGGAGGGGLILGLNHIALSCPLWGDVGMFPYHTCSVNHNLVELRDRFTTMKSIMMGKRGGGWGECMIFIYVCQVFCVQKNILIVHRFCRSFVYPLLIFVKFIVRSHFEALSNPPPPPHMYTKNTDKFD